MLLKCVCVWGCVGVVVGSLLTPIEEKGLTRKDITKPSARHRRAVCSPYISIHPTQDDIYWRVGGVETARCSVLGKNYTSHQHNLTMLKNTSVLKHKVVDSRSIEVTLNLTEPEEYKLMCTDGDGGLCMAHVMVGYEPLPLESMECVSHNWDVFTCTWSLPFNPVQVSESEYKPHLISTANPSLEFPCDCGSNSDYQYYLDTPTSPPHVCTCSERCCSWSGYSYFSIERELEVMFVAKNPLGARNYSYFIDNYAVVLPNPMSEVSVSVMEGLRIAVVAWKLPPSMGTFAKLPGAGVVVRTDYKLVQDSDWVLGSPLPCHGDGCKYGEDNITLPYWHQAYHVRVRLRSAAADDDDAWWSSWHPHNITTPSTRPSSPPVVGVGTFQVVSGAFVGVFDLTFTWQQVATLLHNGSHFHYLAHLCSPTATYTAAATTAATTTTTTTTARRCSEVLQKVSVRDNFAEFHNLSVASQYCVRVSAVNSVGVGPWSECVCVRPDRPVLPTLAVVVEHTREDGFDTLYELLFTTTTTTTTTTKYITVYLCVQQQQQQQQQQQRERSNPCKGRLSWASLSVPSNSSSANVTLDEFGLGEGAPPPPAGELRFGLSQEESGSESESSSSSSSGVCWDECGSPQPYSTSTPAPPSLTKATAVGSVWAEVGWSLECEFWAGVVEGVQATYCAGEHTHTHNCTTGDGDGDGDGGVVMMTFGGDDWSYDVMRVSGLREGTQYTVWLRMSYRNTLSPHSLPLHFKTTTTPNQQQDSHGVEAWVVVLVVTASIITSVIILLILTYTKRKFVDNLKKLRVQPSLPSGLVPEYHFRVDRGGGSEGAAAGGEEGTHIPVSHVSELVKEPDYTQYITGILPSSLSEATERQNRDKGDSSTYSHFKQGRVKVIKQSEYNGTTEDIKGTCVTTSSCAPLLPSPHTSTRITSPSAPLLPSHPQTNYVTPFFYDSEGEECGASSTGGLNADNGSSSSGGRNGGFDAGDCGSGGEDLNIDSNVGSKNVGSDSSSSRRDKNSTINCSIGEGSSSISNGNSGYVQANFFDDSIKFNATASYPSYVSVDNPYGTQDGGGHGNNNNPSFYGTRGKPTMEKDSAYDNRGVCNPTITRGYVSLHNSYDVSFNPLEYVKTDAFSTTTPTDDKHKHVNINNYDKHLDPSQFVKTDAFSTTTPTVNKDKYVDIKFAEGLNARSPCYPDEKSKYVTLDFANDVTASASLNKDHECVIKDETRLKNDQDGLIYSRIVLASEENCVVYNDGFCIDENDLNDVCFDLKVKIRGREVLSGDERVEFNNEMTKCDAVDSKDNDDLRERNFGMKNDAVNIGITENRVKYEKNDTEEVEHVDKLEDRVGEIEKGNYMKLLDAQLAMDVSKMHSELKESDIHALKVMECDNRGYIALLPLNTNVENKNENPSEKCVQGREIDLKTSK